MPIYEFHCEACRLRFEKLYPWKHGDNCTFLDDPAMEQCPDCLGPVEHLSALCNMKPDRFWNGVNDDVTGQYWTSESQYKKYCKEKGYVQIGDRTDREGLTKWAKSSEESRDKKKEKELEGFLLDTFKSEEFGLTGTVKQRNKKAKEIALAESASPSDVFEDSAFK